MFNMVPDKNLKVFEKLRELLRDQNVTYKKLGQYLGMSESGVKKLFKSREITLSRLENICSILGTTVSELTFESPMPQVERTKLSLELQDFFLKDMARFKLYYLLSFENLSFDSIIEKYKIPKSDAQRILRELDKRDLVKRLPHDRIIPNKKISLLYEGNGPFISFFGKKFGGEFLEEILRKDESGDKNVYFTLQSLQLLPESYAEFLSQLSQIIRDFSSRSKREALVFKKKTKHYRVCCLLGDGHFYSS